MKMVRPGVTLITLKVDEGNTMCCTNTLQKWDVFELDKMRWDRIEWNGLQ